MGSYRSLSVIWKVRLLCVKNMGKNISFLRESVGREADALFDEIPELVGMKWDATHFVAAETMHGVKMQGREYELQQSEKMSGY